MADSLRESPELKPFLLSDVRLTGVRIGSGAYGSVEEVVVPGAICAAKRIHEVFMDFSEIPAAEIRKSADQFVRECKLMSTLRHPYIVQFLGVCFLPGSKLPALVMERMLTSLHDLLEPDSNLTRPSQPKDEKRFFPPCLKCSILDNVASGLAYLHERSPPIIHRDLSGRNVLLNSGMVAKIGDLGVARIVPGVRAAAATMTKGPGAIVYMPPEAIEEKHVDEKGQHGTNSVKYDASIDIFSFGVISIFTLCQTFPCNLLAPTYREGRQHKARTELERRERYMRMIYSQLREKHPLIQMIEECLDFPEERPSIREVLCLLEEARAEERDEQTDMNKLELLQALQTNSGSQESTELERRLNRKVTEVEEQLQQKEIQLQNSMREKERVTNMLAGAQQQLYATEREKQSITQQLLHNQHLLRQMHEEKQRRVSEQNRETTVREVGVVPDQRKALSESFTDLHEHKGNIYYIPIVIWLRKNHPQDAPIVYVTPTPGMGIQPSMFVDTNGVVYLPYLSEWKAGTSDLTALVQILCATFASHPPVFSRPTLPPYSPLSSLPAAGTIRKD